MGDKGIILAGGLGTRLYPVTKVISKQLLPVYDKPMIYYPLTTLMLAGIREILVITSMHEEYLFKDLLGNGEQWGISIQYASQEYPRGIPDAFLIGKEFIGNSRICLILGDNIFFGQGLPSLLVETLDEDSHATIFGYWVENPDRYGVLEFNSNGDVIGVQEKPQNPRSHYVVPGLYFFDTNVVSLAEKLVPSERGELEITDLIRHYIDADKLKVKLMSRGMAWLDTGTHSALLEASQFVEVIEKRQGLKIASPEEVAWRKGYISSDQLCKLAKEYISNDYGRYLLNLTNDNL